MFDCLTSKRIQFLTTQNILSLGMAISSLGLIANYSYEYFSIDESDPSNYFFALTSKYKFTWQQAYSFSTLNALLILRVLYIFRLNSTIGPLLKVLLRMARDVFNFTILLFFTVIFFSSVGLTLFTVPQFMSFSASFLTLFSWMLGNFNF